MDIDENDGPPPMAFVLFSFELGSTWIFYEDVLGFDVIDKDDALLVRYGNLELEVRLTEDPDLIYDVGVIFHVPHVRNLHRRLDQRGIPDLGDLIDDASGPVRFSVRDPDGNTLHFVQKAVVALSESRNQADEHKESL